MPTQPPSEEARAWAAEQEAARGPMPEEKVTRLRRLLRQAARRERSTA